MPKYRDLLLFASNVRGATAIEFALVLPVLLLFVFGAIDYGYWFFLDQLAQHTTTNAAYELQKDPTQSFQQVNDVGANFGFLDMRNSPNFVCAVASPSAASAEAATYGCYGNTWSVANPTGNPNTPYYIGISSHIGHRPLVPLSPSWPPRNIYARTMVRINPVNALGTVLPDCVSSGKVLTSDGANLSCTERP